MRLYSLQVLRGFAASAVVLLHASNLSLPSENRWRFDLGAVGVDLFFVLSGVIICLVARGSPAEFLKRRFWRVVPLYFALTLIAGLLVKDITPANVATSLTFWPAWGAMTLPVLGIGWTLCFEMLFYLCVAWSLRGPWQLLLATFGLCMAGLFATGATVFQFLGNPIILEFLAGVVIAHWWKQGVRAQPWPLIGAGVAILLLIPDVQTITTIEQTMTGETSLARAFLVGTPCALIVWGFLNLEVGWPKFLIAAGDASYSIYLAHAVALTPFYFVILPSWLPAVPFYLFISGCAAFFAYQWIERPLLERTRGNRLPAQYHAAA